MKKQIAFVAGTALCVGAASAQMSGGMGAAASIVPGMDAGEAGGRSNVRNPVVASLEYDGVATYGFAGQDFESVFDLYDTFCCERFSTDADANLTEFRSTGFGNGNPFGTTDFICEIYEASQEADICDDGTLPAPLMISVPGAGFYDGVDGVTDFDSGGDPQCLPGGDYIARWGAELNFGTFGQVFFFAQAGDHTTGGGTADDGFQSNPGNAFGMGFCFDVVDGGTGLPTGINFILCGDTADCGGGDPCVSFCGDIDGDGDSDSDDFFTYLDLFVAQDPCADIDQDGDHDSDDFFSYLDLFVIPC